jgi:hypothetical protein
MQLKLVLPFNNFHILCQFQDVHVQSQQQGMFISLGLVRDLKNIKHFPLVLSLLNQCSQFELWIINELSVFCCHRFLETYKFSSILSIDHICI